MQNQGDFKLCASSTDVVKRFAVIKSVIIKRVHCIQVLSDKVGIKLDKVVYTRHRISLDEP